MSRINETLKQAVDELDLDRRLNEFADQAEVVIGRALDSAGGYARDHRDDVERVLMKVTETIDERTDSRFAEHVAKVRDQVWAGMERLAERVPAAPEDRDGPDGTEEPGHPA